MEKVTLEFFALFGEYKGKVEHVVCAEMLLNTWYFASLKTDFEEKLFPT